MTRHWKYAFIPLSQIPFWTGVLVERMDGGLWYLIPATTGAVAYSLLMLWIIRAIEASGEAA